MEPCTKDLWDYLAQTDKIIVMYGMGNGADKILAVCHARGITVKEFFASDGFVRGQVFHGKVVRTWGDIKAEYGADRVIVLLSFGSSRPEVLETVLRICDEAECYAPDVPAFGDNLFDRAFYNAHLCELEAARALLSDELSRKIFDGVTEFKLTGNIPKLLTAVSNPEEDLCDLVLCDSPRAAADLGAYNGDTVRELLSLAPVPPARIYAMEPDARNYRKLQAYAAEETRTEVHTFPVGAWKCADTLFFDGSGNRNASLLSGRSASLEDRPVKVNQVEVDALDHILQGAPVDYIKYDVEGAEREALEGSEKTVNAHLPTLLVSLYHRSEDLFALPLQIKKMFPEYGHYYLRRAAGIPAWDLALYVKK